MGLKEKMRKGMYAEVRRWQPYIAAVFNFLVWGLGYLFNRQRRLLGLALCSFVLSLYIGAIYFMNTQTVEALYTTSIVIVIAWMFLSLALARDAYNDSKKKIAEIKEKAGDKG